jgi:glyoxylase-like metal-dependent hydrolase (beta-lactamase superfamily II)
MDQWCTGGHEPLVELSRSVYCHVDTCNVYVVVRGSRALLIDFGSGSVLKHLHRLGITQVDWILHTHHHRDQCLGHSTATSGARVAIPAAEAHLMEDTHLFWRTKPIHSQYDCASDWNTLASGVVVDRRLEDGDSLNWSGIELRVLPTPGHTRGSVTYLADIDGLRYAFSGDLVCAGGRTWTLHDLQWHYDQPDGLGVALQSVRCLALERPQRLAPSHGPPSPEAPGCLAALERKLGRLYELLEPGYGPVEAGPTPSPAAAEYEQVTEHLIAVRRGNADFYVLTSDSGSCLFFDYGFPGWAHCQGSASRFLPHSLDDLAERFGLSPPEVVMPTHYHDDHVCGIPHLRRRFGTEVWAHEAFADILERPGSYRLPCLWRESVDVTRRVLDGSRVRWQEFEFEARHLPGHTHYAAAYLGEIDGRRVAVVGDQLELDRVGRARGGGPVYRNRVAVGDYVRGIDRIRDFNPDLILTGHKGPLRLSRAQLVEARRWGMRLDEAWESLAAFPTAPEFSLDPGIATVAPYRTSARPGIPFRLAVTIRNPLPRGAKVTCRLTPPPAWDSAPVDSNGFVGARSEMTFVFEVTTPRLEWAPARQLVTADVSLDGWRWGQQAEAIVDLEVPPKEESPAVAGLSGDCID